MNTQDLTSRVQDWQHKAGETARQWGSATDEYVRENTWTTIALAAVVGCIVGYLLAGGRSGD